MLDFNVRHSRNLRASLLSRLAVTAFTVIAAISPLSAQEEESEPGKLIPSPRREVFGAGIASRSAGIRPSSERSRLRHRTPKPCTCSFATRLRRGRRWRD